VRAARAEAERIVDDLRTEVRATREALERETVTAPALDDAVARAEAGLSRLPAPEPAPIAEPAVERQWRLGERARSRSGGWQGRIAALERGGRRATLEAGGMRVTVDVDDLVPALGDEASDRARDGRGPEPTSNVAELRLERAHSVASSLDLRGARVDEALEALMRYLDDAGLAGLDKVLIIHGMGTGAVRDAVRATATGHPLVKSLRPGQRGEGGDGATIVSL
jgi:DNA mismatch repair protein MutS2